MAPEIAGAYPCHCHFESHALHRPRAGHIRVYMVYYVCCIVQPGGPICKPGDMNAAQGLRAGPPGASGPAERGIQTRPDRTQPRTAATPPIRVTKCGQAEYEVWWNQHKTFTPPRPIPPTTIEKSLVADARTIGTIII